MFIYSSWVRNLPVVLNERVIMEKHSESGRQLNYNSLEII